MTIWGVKKHHFQKHSEISSVSGSQKPMGILPLAVRDDWAFCWLRRWFEAINRALATPRLEPRTSRTTAEVAAAGESIVERSWCQVGPAKRQVAIRCAKSAINCKSHVFLYPLQKVQLFRCEKSSFNSKLFEINIEIKNHWTSQLRIRPFFILFPTRGPRCPRLQELLLGLRGAARCCLWDISLGTWDNDLRKTPLTCQYHCDKHHEISWKIEHMLSTLMSISVMVFFPHGAWGIAKHERKIILRWSQQQQWWHDGIYHIPSGNNQEFATEHHQ